MPDDRVPGTTRSRSDKALGRARRDPVEVDTDEQEWDARPITVKTKSGVKECFRVGALARAWDNRTVYSIYKLEQRGVLPKALYRRKVALGKDKGHRSDRLYTREQIELVVRLAHAHGVYKRGSRVRFQSISFTQELLQHWGGSSSVAAPRQEG